jgi:hypothetical protein
MKKEIGRKSLFRVSILTKGSILQWYPGHIAKAEKELKSQIKLMDVIIEVRDARAPMATTHPEVPHNYFYLSLLVHGFIFCTMFSIIWLWKS